ncbi:MAG: hypothetical protein ACREFO_19310 [Acetobacteraceae bacterium]
MAKRRSGTDVAREAAAVVLLDDNFATVVAAVAEGRRIFDDIRKFASYVLTCNAAEVIRQQLDPTADAALVSRAIAGLPMALARKVG